MKEELQSQIRENEIIKKEKKAREYYNDIKMIEAMNNDDMDRKETENNHKQQENAKMKSFKEEREVLIKIKNELKEIERKKIKDEEKQVSTKVRIALHSFLNTQKYFNNRHSM